MPIFHYHCRKCGKRFEVFQRITDNPLKKCSFCSGKVDRVDIPSHTAPSSQPILFGPLYKKEASRKMPRKEEKKQARGGRRRA